MKICPNCNATNPDGAKTCQECSMPLPGSTTPRKAQSSAHSGTRSKPRISFSHYSRSESFRKWLIAIVLLFLICGIAAGFVFRIDDLTAYEFLSSRSEGDFNWVLMISVWLSGVVPSVILYAIYAHLENQEIMINALNAIYEKTADINDK